MVAVGTNREAESAQAAQENRQNLNAAGVLAVQLVGTPGCGKTSLIESTLDALRCDLRSGVIVSHPGAQRDVERLRGLTHHCRPLRASRLDALQLRGELNALPLPQLDLLLIESIGPDELNLGQTHRVAVFSVAGGDDKAVEYPRRVGASSLILLNKTDLMPYVVFNRASFHRDINELNPGARIIEVSSRSRDGFDGWIDWLRRRVIECKASRCVETEDSMQPEWFFG